MLRYIDYDEKQSCSKRFTAGRLLFHLSTMSSNLSSNRYAIIGTIFHEGEGDIKHLTTIIYLFVIYNRKPFLFFIILMLI